MDNFFLFVDIETTGHDPVLKVEGKLVVPYHEIIDIGAVLATQTFKRVKTFEQKVRPEHPERCLDYLINNYKKRSQDGEWKNALVIQHAMGKFLHFINSVEGQKNMIYQNPAFDWSFLVIAFAQYGITTSDLMAFHNVHYAKGDSRSCAIQELWLSNAPFQPNDYSLRKGILSQRLGIEDENLPHTAINGAMKCYEVCKKLREMREVR